MIIDKLNARWGTISAKTRSELALSVLATCIVALPTAPATAQPNLAELEVVPAPAMPSSIELGTGSVPGMPPESWTSDGNGFGVRNVSNATLTPILPHPWKSTGAAVILAPGGAFVGLAMNEGMPVAQFLADNGVAVFVLKYRLRPTPARIEDYRQFLVEQFRQAQEGKLNLSVPPQSLEDAKAAIRLVRSRASEWNIDPERVGMMGFSAGASLTLGLTLDSSVEEMPAFIAPIYGPMNPVTVPAAAPPMFASMAADDPLFGNRGYGLIETWQRAGKPVELHVYQSGGHGYGIGRPGTTTVSWIDDFVRWLDVNRMLGRQSDETATQIAKPTSRD